MSVVIVSAIVVRGKIVWASRVRSFETVSKACLWWISSSCKMAIRLSVSPTTTSGFLAPSVLVMFFGQVFW